MSDARKPDAINPCAMVPVYNHPAVLERTVVALLDRQLPVLLIDDGSDAHCRTLMERLAADHPRVHLLQRPQNGGKGAALKDGLREALRLHYSHAIQVDADGQHDLNDVARFLKIAGCHPNALVAGYPAYDASVPRHRYYARYVTHVWVWINSLSLEIKDAMCGFRVYPTAASCALLEHHSMGDRMDFDVEFIVRWWCSGRPLQQLHTRVIYPEGGISHFRLWRDNLLISRMHARLFFCMLSQLPRRLLRRRRCPEQIS